MMVDAYTASLVASQHRELLKEFASLRTDLMARLDQLDASVEAIRRVIGAARDGK